MKKGVLFLVCAMIFTMLAPAQAAEIPQTKEPEMPVQSKINGKYVVSVKCGEEWREIGTLNFGKFQSTEAINLGNLMDESIAVKLSQVGGGSAYLDAVLLDGQPAVKANNNDEKLISKLSREDLDITPVGEDGVVLEFNRGKSDVLTVVGRIENIVIGKEPLQFPSENNYKSKDDIENFYTYTIGSNVGTVKADGILDKTANKEPFVKEYRVPGSGHPAGDTYFWVMNDNENLYVTMDVTPDNTFDGDKDYAKVYVDTSYGIKEFKISVPETTWGNTGFTYTDKVVYEHKVYEFSIPLSEIDNSEVDINLAFVIYGTVAMPTEFYTPDLAYDANSDVYVCVYEGYNYNGNYIWADIIKSDGTVINEYPILISDHDKQLFTPSIAYDYLNDSFMVVWCQGNSNTKIYGRLFELIENGEDTYIDFLTEEFRVSGNKDIGDTEWKFYEEFEPDIAFNRNYEDGEYNEHYLVVWTQRVNDNPANLSLTKNDIYGRFVSSDGTLVGDKGFAICNGIGNQYEPSLSYSFRSEMFMLAWIDESSGNSSVNACVINEDGTLGKSINPIIGNVKNPNIAINERNDFFLLTWVQDNQVKGVYCYYNYNYNNIFFLDTFTLSSSGYENKYPVSVFGKYNMLSIWNSIQIDTDNSYVKLSYWDIYEPIDEVFETENPELTEYDNWDKSIDIASNYLDNENGYEKFIVAYINKGGEAISYRAIGEDPPPVFEPYIEFDSSEYPIDLDLNNSVQAEVYLYSYKNQEEGNNITTSSYTRYISNNPEIATISETGLITGLTVGTTQVKAIYYEPQYNVMSLDGEMELPYGTLEAVANVTVSEAKEPSLNFVPYEIKKYIGDEFSVKINYFDGFATTDVTDEVVISIDDPGIATSDSAIKGKFICKAAGETILRTTYSGITATANLIVEKRETTSGSSTPVRTPIGQILVDNKVIETLYEGDVIAKNNTYTFTADKSGESAKLWLDSEFYKGMAKDYPKRIINFNWDKGTYTLPLSCDEVLNEIDNSANKVNIFIEKVDDKEIISAAKDSAEKIGAEIISDLVDFSVYIEKSKGNTDIDSLDFYAERTINQLDKINENVSTAMKFVDDKTTLTFAPSVFNDDLANIKYRGNGIFTIVKNPQTFNDIANHWARLNIEKLASRNIAFGKENNNFAPNDFITRAEFSVMITRALGITEEEGANDFNDVSNEWYAEDISTAFSSGLINGRNDGKFYPNEKIQRKDMAVIIQNALKFVDIDYEISDEDSILKIFKDESIISDYAREATAICANSGIIMGRETKNFDPDANATRAEASAIIERMLRYIEFMN